jgi:hypothetical protein
MRKSEDVGKLSIWMLGEDRFALRLVVSHEVKCRRSFVLALSLIAGMSVLSWDTKR